MWWDDARKWLADKIAPIEKKADAELAEHVRGVRIPRARYLVALAVLAICVVGYWRGWHNRLWGAARDLKPAQTQGNVPGVYQAPPVPAAEKAPATASRITPRTRKKADLPKKEQDLFPVVPPPAPAAGGDNAAIRTWAECIDADGHLLFKPGCEIYRPQEAELAAASTVPPHRGDTEIRTYLMPDGSFNTSLVPKPERFFGLEWKHVEVEGRYGLVGNTQAKATGRWMPLRLGDVHVGAEGSVAVETGGVTRTEVLGVVRWEPFRESYP